MEGVREEVGRWSCSLKEDDDEEEEEEEEVWRNLPAPTRPSATHTFSPAAADRHPAEEHRCLQTAEVRHLVKTTDDI